MATQLLGGLTVNNPLQTANTGTGTSTSLFKHDIGQFAGHLLNALPGYSTLGSQITSPNVNYLGVPNPGYSTSGSSTSGASPTVIPNSIAPSPQQQQLYYDNAGNGYSSQAAADSANVNLTANNRLIDLINASLGRLPGELSTAKSNLQHQFDTNSNELQSGYDQAHQQYGQQTNQNQQQFVTNKNQINEQASHGLTSLLRLLGQHGAGGSSAAMFAAPNAVSQVAAQQRSGANQTYGENQANLDTNFNTYQTGFDNSKKQLNDWLAQQQQAAAQTSNDNEQQLREELLGISPTVATAQAQVDKINALRDSADKLQAFNPTYDGKAPVYTAPSVASYTVGQVGAPTFGNAGNGTSAASPALAFLLGLNKDKNQLQPQF